jgi:hypothetical protein
VFERGMPPAAGWSKPAAAGAAVETGSLPHAWSRVSGRAGTGVAWSGPGDGVGAGETGSSSRVIPRSRSNSDVDARVKEIGRSRLGDDSDLPGRGAMPIRRTA